MTYDELQTIMERCNKATPGSWTVAHTWASDEMLGTLALTSDSDDIGEIFTEENAAFIVHAREDIPALIAEVKWLREHFQRIINTPTDFYGASLQDAYVKIIWTAHSALRDGLSGEKK